MKKLTLDLDDLRIESFRTTEQEAEERGTVHAHDQCGCSCCCTGYTQPCQATCDTSPSHPGYPSCGNTCDYSACYGTCYDSCGGSCGWSCGYCGPEIQQP
ncbi:MAG TPA: hypothetical protein VFQ45_06930 [Longimicrobium sp.]|nr:hypothetical protein [Longimicrobium sp.]